LNHYGLVPGTLGALRAERVDVIYRERASGKATKGRPELEKAIDELGRGDILVVTEWDRATRSSSMASTSSSASIPVALSSRCSTSLTWT